MIQMMESLSDELGQGPNSIESPAWHQDVLSQQEESLQIGDDVFEDWKSAKSSIRIQVPLENRLKVLGSIFWTRCPQILIRW